MGDSKVGIVIVTYNSARFMQRALDALQEQHVPGLRTIVVDNASSDTAKWAPLCKDPNMTLFLRTENMGFCRANNLAAAEFLDSTDFILFLNPDCFLTPGFVEEALSIMARTEHEGVGALTGTLIGFDVELGAPTGVLDSTGIFRTWYGRWFDRDQGQPTAAANLDQRLPETIPAICGALMFCRTAALKSVLYQGQIFDESFFMYKEDIDLSRRLAAAGWQLLFAPQLRAFHCRGWNPNRKAMSLQSRNFSARNEVKLHWKQRSACVLYSLLKLLYVRLFER